MRDGKNDKQQQCLRWLAGLKTMASLAMFPMPLANGTIADLFDLLLPRLPDFFFVL
jgi:hypothetical protein